MRIKISHTPLYFLPLIPLNSSLTASTPHPPISPLASPPQLFIIMPCPALPPALAPVTLPPAQPP